MNRFFRRIDLRNRQHMTTFLRGHARHWTMNSWNRSSSYANCVKVHRLGLTPEQLGKAWEMLDIAEVYDSIREILEEWSAGHQWRWQVGFNGRSSGYLVLYQGGLDYRSARTAQCDSCGKLTWHGKEVPCTSEDCDGVLRLLPDPKPRIVTYPGRGVDESEDFRDWGLHDLRDRVRLVQDFDRICDEAVACFAGYCDRYDVAEEQILVPKTVKALVPAVRDATHCRMKR